MTEVLVSDTSVLIDLERGLRVEPAFRLLYRFAVPDLLYVRELHAQSDIDYRNEHRAPPSAPCVPYRIESSLVYDRQEKVEKGVDGGRTRAHDARHSCRRSCFR